MVTCYGSNTLVNTGTKTYEICLQGRYTDQWTVTWFTFKGPEGHEKLIGFHFQPLSDRLEHLNKFSLNGKPVLNYLMLLLAVLIVIFVLATLLACIRTRIPKRKWLWCIFVCLGFVGISLNWTNGVVSIDPIRVYIPGVTVTAASPYAPWVITVSVPIGAILFWFRRRKWLREDSAG